MESKSENIVNNKLVSENVKESKWNKVKLPSHSRMRIYSYLELKEFIKVCSLSKEERVAITKTKLID